MDKRNLYWTLQFTGWIIYVLVSYLTLPLFHSDLKEGSYMLVISFITGILITHAYRAIIKKYHWDQLPMVQLTVRVLIVSLVATFVFLLVQVVFHSIVLTVSNDDATKTVLEPESKTGLFSFLFISALKCYLVFMVWSILYLVFHYFENYKSAQLKAATAETQLSNATLQNLRNQINPHFLFNALNSIKSLTLTEPEKARIATTLLSEILRYTLNAEKNTTVSIADELQVVDEYLQLETIRFGARLSVHKNIDVHTNALLLPPLMLLTLAENAIKHGIAQRVDGGAITINSYTNDYYHVVELINTGQLNSKNQGIGIGIKNSLQRLQIIFGQDAIFKLQNLNNFEVLAQILIPLSTQTNNQ